MSYSPSFPQPGSGYPGAPQPGHAHGHGHPHAPQQQQQQQQQLSLGGGARNIDETANFEGAAFRISYRDSNSLLSVRLQPGYEIKAKPGSMVAMDATVKIRGEFKLSFKKIITGGELSESTFTGPGEVLLAPETWGDLVPIVLDGSTPWFFSKHAFLACTPGVKLTHKAQSFGKALFSGEGLFVDQANGAGVLIVASLGAVLQRRLGPDEQWVVDNGHLVAWTAKYSVERIKAGGMLSGAKTDEGLVCRFTGPGTIYIQTRNPETLVGWIADQMPSSSA